MENNLDVKITYRNAKLDPISTQIYPIEDYTAMLRNDLLRLITDIEDAFYIASGDKSREEWPDDVWSAYLRIKHKILDKAGDIGRLPRNIIIGDEHGNSDV